VALGHDVDHWRFASPMMRTRESRPSRLWSVLGRVRGRRADRPPSAVSGRRSPHYHTLRRRFTCCRPEWSCLWTNTVDGPDTRLLDPATAITSSMPCRVTTSSAAATRSCDGRLFFRRGHIVDGRDCQTRASTTPSAIWTAAPHERRALVPHGTTLATATCWWSPGKIDNTVGVDLLPQVFQARAGRAQPDTRSSSRHLPRALGPQRPMCSIRPGARPPLPRYVGDRGMDRGSSHNTPGMETSALR